MSERAKLGIGSAAVDAHEYTSWDAAEWFALLCGTQTGDMESSDAGLKFQLVGIPGTFRVVLKNFQYTIQRED